ncbi:hypothetical protein LguiB_026877 [Lonicera macranthoides]
MRILHLLPHRWFPLCPNISSSSFLPWCSAFSFPLTKRKENKKTVTQTFQLNALNLEGERRLRRA